LLGKFDSFLLFFAHTLEVELFDVFFYAFLNAFQVL